MPAFTSPSRFYSASRKAHLKQQKKPAKPTFKPNYLTLAVSTVLGTFAVPSMAGPEGGVIRGGAGSISQNGKNTTINQTTDRMAIDWNSFDIASDERVQFIQPDSQSVSLNRVLSNNGTRIQGRIDANGQVVLVNPNGVIFTESAVINAGGILASGLSIDPNEFMNGNLAFERLEGTNGTVINRGILQAATGGNVGLIGTQVENSGLIEAELGHVALAAGNKAVVRFDEAGLIGVTVTEAILQQELGEAAGVNAGANAGVSNSGTINAQGGKVLLSASASRDIFTQAVNAGNLQQATSVTVDADGSFTLSAGSNVVNTGAINVNSSASATENINTNAPASAGQAVLLGENITQNGRITANSEQGTAGNIELHSHSTTLISGELIANSTQGDAGQILALGNQASRGHPYL